MYKNRFYFWIFIFIFAMFINSAMNLNIGSMIVESRDISINIDADSSIKSNMINAKTGSIILSQTSTNPSVIIKDAGSEQIDGYTKIEGAIFSPIVMYIPTDAPSPSSLYYHLGGNPSFANFKDIADGILDNKTLDELGLSEDDESKDSHIILNLPSKGTFYYDAVIEQIFIALNDNKPVDNNKREELSDVVDKLIEKSVVCNDVSAKIDDNPEDYNIFIAPEYYLKNGNFGISKGYGRYQPVYFEKTIAIGYDAFIKSDESYGESSLIDIFNTQILGNENFISSSNYRTTKYSDYNSHFSGYIADNLDYQILKQ